MQEHKIGIPVWPYKYRITMRANRMEIANSNDFTEIQMDWRYLETYAVPQLSNSIDLYNGISDPLKITMEILKKFF